MTNLMSAGQDKPHRTWDVLLIGGASGTGKTSISYRVAQYFGVGITEIDDFQLILAKMTTPEQQPALHYWNTHPDAIYLPPERLFELTVACGEAMSPALEVVIVNHLESNAPIVLEGDFMLPSLPVQLAASNPAKYAKVRAVFIHEPSESQLVSNYASREPNQPPQTVRARVSWLYGNWLKQQAEEAGFSVIEARPWDTLFERLLALLRT